MKRLVVLALIFAGAGCAPTEQSADNASAALLGAPDGPLVALVNGEALTEPLLVTYAKGRGLDPAIPQQRQQALDGLIENVLIVQDAAASGMLAKPEVQAEASLVRLQQITARAVAEQREKLSVDETQVLALYEQERQRAGDTEWRVQHILFAAEAPAKTALQRALAEGANFEALMAEYAAGIAKQARELPWSNATQLPESLVAALKQLEDGQIAPLVINSSFGWHVLRRIESRPFSPPPLEEVREGATRQIIERGLREYLDGLRAKAEITTAAGTPAAGN